MAEKFVDAAEWQVTPGRPLPPNLPGKPFNPHGAAYDADTPDRLAALPPKPQIVDTLKTPVYDPATGEITHKDTGIPLTPAADGSLKPLAMTHEDVARLSAHTDAMDKLTRSPVRLAPDGISDLNKLVWESEKSAAAIETGKDPFYEARKIARIEAEPRFGSMDTPEITGYCQWAAAQLGLEVCYSPLLSREQVRTVDASGRAIDPWVYLVRRPGTGHIVYGPTPDLIGLARVLMNEVNNREDAAQRAADTAAHLAELQSKTVVRAWVGDEPTEMDELKAELARLRALVEAP